MSENSALCLRFDLDTFASRHAYTADVGWGAYAYIPRILRVASAYAEKNAKFQFCACGQGMEEYPFDIEQIRVSGHPIDSHLYSHRVTLTGDAVRVAEELVLTEKVFSDRKVPWSGIGATGMYPNGIDDQSAVQELLTERGYQWCSTKYNRDLPLREMQPYWLNDFLLEIPCAGMSDRNYFCDGKAQVAGFISQVLAMLEQAAENDLIYAIDLHPGVLAKYDPACEFVTAVVNRAVELGIPLVTMDQITRWKTACREVNRFNSGERVGDKSTYGNVLPLPDEILPGEAPTLQRYLVAVKWWEDECAQPVAQPEKVVDYVGGWRAFPNSRRNGVSINRFGLRGLDCLRTKPANMKRVLCIGDSCVFGAAPEDGPWPAQLQIRLDQKAPLQFQVLNAGVNGQKSLNVYLRLPQLLENLKPDVLLISVLANDAWQTAPDHTENVSAFKAEEFRQHVQWAIDICRQYGVTPVLITPPGMVPTDCRMTPYMLLAYHQAHALGERKQPEKMRQLYDIHNDAVRALAEKNDLVCIDVAKAFDEQLDDRRGELFFDTCHMLKEGNIEMGRIVSEGLLRMSGPSLNV